MGEAAVKLPDTILTEQQLMEMYGCKQQAALKTALRRDGVFYRGGKNCPVYTTVFDLSGKFQAQDAANSAIEFEL